MSCIVNSYKPTFKTIKCSAMTADQIKDCSILFSEHYGLKYSLISIQSFNDWRMILLMSMLKDLVQLRKAVNGWPSLSNIKI